jgi:hypothetical protein
MLTTKSQEQPLLLTRDEACRALGIKLSQYKLLVGKGLLREVAIGVRGRRLPYSEALRFAQRLVVEALST